MLEKAPGDKITIAKIAADVGVSEAAIYRHFASKAQIFEALITFAEEALLSRINTIHASDQPISVKTQDFMLLLLTFFERNPGIARLLLGDPLVGEAPRLKPRVRQLFDKMETACRQALRDAQSTAFAKPPLSPTAQTALVMQLIEGAVARYVRSEFAQSPTEHFAEQWPIIEIGLTNTDV
jgi:TetR/AcrR family transcriptional regulator